MIDQPRTYIPTPSAELDAAAEITEADVGAAVAQWRRDAPSGFRGRFDAVPYSGTTTSADVA